MRKHSLIIVIGFTVGVLFYAFHNFNENVNFFQILLHGFLGIGISYIFHFINQFLNRAIDWKKQTGLRLLLGILVHLLFGMAVIYLALRTYEIVYPRFSFFSNNEQMALLKMAILLFCVVLINNIIYFAFYSYQQYVHGQLLESRLKRKQTELQLRALKSQLSPHFLFNCLNALSSLVIKDVKSSETFIRSLAKSYQYTLKTYQTTVVKVSEELEFVKSYYFLMKTRFQEQIELDVQVSEQLGESFVPPMTLQMLVENAIKHNVADTSRPLNIQIISDKGYLGVTNNITKERTGVKSTQIGLKNIESRYKMLTKTPVEVIAQKLNFTVKLPVLE